MVLQNLETRAFVYSREHIVSVEPALAEPSWRTRSADSCTSTVLVSMFDVLRTVWANSGPCQRLGKCFRFPIAELHCGLHHLLFTFLLTFTYPTVVDSAYVSVKRAKKQIWYSCVIPVHESLFVPI